MGITYQSFFNDLSFWIKMSNLKSYLKITPQKSFKGVDYAYLNLEYVLGALMYSTSSFKYGLTVKSQNHMFLSHISS